MTISPWLQIIVVIIGLSGPGLLHDDELPGWANGLIALGVIAVCSYFMTMVGGRLTGNSNEDIGLYALIASGLLIGPLRPLSEDLQKLPGVSCVLHFLKPHDERKKRKHTMQKVHARFRLIADTRVQCHAQKDNKWQNVQGAHIKLSAVQGEPFGTATPMGSVEMTIANPEAARMFQNAEIGQEFDFLISPVPKEEK